MLFYGHWIFPNSKVQSFYLIFKKCFYLFIQPVVLYRLLEDRPGDEENLDNLGFEEISDEELEEEARANKGRLSTYYFCS